MVMSPGFAISNAPKQRRITRSPSHPFYIQTKPFGIYPFMLAPVLPGETLKNLQLQSRVVTDPVASPLVGFWKEYYFFYVKLRDLPATIAAAVETMLLDPSASLSAVDGSTDSAPYYFAPGAGDAMNWSIACMERVVESFFRDQDETWNTQTIDGVPKAKFNQRDWTDSLWNSTEMPAGATLVGVEDFDLMEARYRTWLLVRQQQLTDMTFEDYLATYGVHVPAPGKGKPELLRYIRDWAYPSNTVEPTTGVPASAVSWSIAERADKDRFFTEPGFIFGVTVCRPKTYKAAQVQSASVMLDSALSWMPALLNDDPASSLKEVLNVNPANNPMGSTYAADYTLDVRDLYLYGDQFLRTSSPILDAGGDAHVLPAVGGNHYTLQYPSDAGIALLWKDRDTAEPYTATKIYCREDGVVKLNILGTQMDHT